MKENAEIAFNNAKLTEDQKLSILKKIGTDLLAFSQQMVTRKASLDWRVRVLSIETGYSHDFIYMAICTALYESVRGGLMVL